MTDFHSMPNELASIYITTFQHVGQKFLDSLMQQITIRTKVSSTILIQLLSIEEYKELSNIYSSSSSDKKKFYVLSPEEVDTASSSPEMQSSLASEDNNSSPQQQQLQPQHPTAVIGKDGSISASNETLYQDQFLLIRSCFSTSSDSIDSIQPNTIIPLSCLNSATSPYIKALLNDTKISNYINEKSNSNMDPPFEHFHSIRLESYQPKKKNEFIKGIICVMDNKPMNTPLISTILNTVHDRCINELNQLQTQEQLISARDLALLDAENKLKFLADMSHEIRTPMNAVIALTDLLLQERSTLNMEQIEHLEVIQTSGSHLLTIINDILDISKLNHDPKFKLESRRFTLRKCLKDTLNMARHQASMSQQNKVVYVLECPPDKDDNLPLPQLISQLENSGILLRPLLTNKKGKTVLPVIWKIDSDVPDHLLGDTMRLTQIMLNLCSNAVKFTKEGGIYIHIKRSTPTPLRTPSIPSNERRMTFKERYNAKIETMWNRALQERRERNNSNPLSPNPLSNNSSAASGLATSEDGGGDDYFGEKSILEISVTDTGIGIPADRLPKLFKSFSQIDISTARRYGGTGLGLAISSTLVNRMGGCVWVESEEGVGSTFALTLPMTVAPRGRNYSNDSTPMGGPIGSPSSPSSTISDSSSVHSVINGNVDGIYTFTTPAVNNAPSNPSYFPLTTPPTANQQQQQRPLLPRSTTYQFDYYNRLAAESIAETMQQQQQNNEQPLPFSPMAEDAPSDLRQQQQQTTAATNTTNNNNNNQRKACNDLLSPAARNSRVAITKQQYHNRKPQTKEENLAKLHPLRILLAEDNILNQKIAISILKRLGYVDVAIANNGKEVLSLMKTSVFDVIFMDLYMPEMDGLEVTREIIKERKGKQKLLEDTTETETETTEEELLNTVDVYIIALTASASREDRQICIGAGMNDFISKPFTMTEMKSALKTCANKRKKRRKLVAGAAATSSPPSQAEVVLEDDPMLDIEETTTTAAVV